MNVDEPVGVERGDPAVVRGELVGLARRPRSSSSLDAGVVGRGQQRLEIPDDVVGGEVGRGHGAGSYSLGSTLPLRSWCITRSVR